MTASDLRSYYMDGLTRLQPQDIQQIEKLSNELIHALQQQKNPFHGRNVRAVNRINKSLAEWAETDEQKKLAKHFSSTVSSLCSAQEEGAQCSGLEGD